MSSNPELYTRKIVPSILANPHAYPLIKYKIKNDYYIFASSVHLSSNANPRVLKLLRTHQNYISGNLSANPSDEAINLLCAYPDLIDYEYLSANTNPRIRWLLKANYDKLDKDRLSSNPLIFSHIEFNSKNTSKILDNLNKGAKRKLTQLIKSLRFYRSIQDSF